MTWLDDSRDLGESMVIRTGQEKEPHWNDSAAAVIGGLISLVAAAEKTDRSLQTVRELLATRFDQAAEIMCQSGGLLARMGGRLKQFAGQEKGGVLSTANRHLGFLDSPAIAAVTRTSSFDPSDLVKGKVTVYLVLPPERLRAQAGWLRMMIGALMRAVIKAGVGNKGKVTFLIDEASALKKFDPILDVLDRGRGYSMSLMLIYQSRAQLLDCWPEGLADNVMANTTQVFFAVNDNETAEYVSKRLGEETISVASGGTNDGGSRQASDAEPGRSYGQSWGRNDNWNQVGRALLKPEEVLALDPRVTIVFQAGCRPFWSYLTRFYESRAPPKWKLAAVAKTLFLFLLSTIAAWAATR